MLVGHLSEQVSPQILSQVEPYSLILLSPRMRTRSQFLAGLPSDSVVYYALQPDERDLQALMSGLAANLSGLQSGGGETIRQALEQRRPKPDQLARATLSDLSQLGANYLVLDALDYLVLDDDTSEFFKRLLANLPANMKLVVNTRLLSHRFWVPFIQSGQGTVLSGDLDGECFTPGEIDKPHLEVYALAGGSVYIDGMPITSWDGPLPRNLFYFLVDRPLVTRDEIFETFWPELSIKEATNVFHVTKRKISTTLGYELTDYAGGFYRHADALTFRYDVAAFEQAIARSELMTPEQAYSAWEQAVGYYRGTFLPAMDMPWVRQRRDALQLAYADILIQMGRVHQSQDNNDLAVSFFLRAQREFPEREDLCRNLMSLYHNQGDNARVTEQYRLLQGRLRTKLGIAPSKATQALYHKIVQNDA